MHDAPFTRRITVRFESAPPGIRCGQALISSRPAALALPCAHHTHQYAHRPTGARLCGVCGHRPVVFFAGTSCMPGIPVLCEPCCPAASIRLAFRFVLRTFLIAEDSFLQGFRSHALQADRAFQAVRLGDVKLAFSDSPHLSFILANAPRRAPRMNRISLPLPLDSPLSRAFRRFCRRPFR